MCPCVTLAGTQPTCFFAAAMITMNQEKVELAQLLTMFENKHIQKVKYFIIFT
jgi:hypothetical protein